MNRGRTIVQERTSSRPLLGTPQTFVECMLWLKHLTRSWEERVPEKRGRNQHLLKVTMYQIRPQVFNAQLDV